MAKTHNEIKNKKISEKTGKKNIVFILVILFLIMFATSLIYIFEKQDEVYYDVYNNFRFEKYENDYWITLVARGGSNYEAIFYNHPLEVEHYPYENNVSILTLEKPHTNIIITLSPDSNVTAVTAAANIARITGKFFKIPTSSALYVLKEERENYNYTNPMIDCSEATELQPVIWLRPEANETKVHLHKDYPNCILIDSNGPEEINEIGDLYTYKILEIIK